jgi:hypothetical protein
MYALGAVRFSCARPSGMRRTSLRDVNFREVIFGSRDAGKLGDAGKVSETRFFDMSLNRHRIEMSYFRYQTYRCSAVEVTHRF